MKARIVLLVLTVLFVQSIPVVSQEFPSLHKSKSSRGLFKTAVDNPGPLYSFSKEKTDTLHVLAIRIEFKRDTLDATTGTGNFSDMDDPDEIDAYSDTSIYKYDNMLHDADYFKHQLEYAKNYFDKVSRGKFHLEYSIFPPKGSDAYAVREAIVLRDSIDTTVGVGPNTTKDTVVIRKARSLKDTLTMGDYSPAGKKSKESWDEYGFR
ncbi:MAG: hypothetical protein GF350_13365, partial [Chitinivibrionales bacterium]|nr:hypothetical protein [Chitinivibrionales bacterium]